MQTCLKFSLVLGRCQYRPGLACLDNVNACLHQRPYSAIIPGQTLRRNTGFLAKRPRDRIVALYAVLRPAVLTAEQLHTEQSNATDANKCSRPQWRCQNQITIPLLSPPASASAFLPPFSAPLMEVKAVSAPASKRFLRTQRFAGMPTSIICLYSCAHVLSFDDPSSDQIPCVCSCNKVEAR